jgi:hypothetical protein
MVGDESGLEQPKDVRQPQCEANEFKSGYGARGDRDGYSSRERRD